ncbi:hypothetical protein [Kineosporia sp. NBRC 101731]|uniref:hypothetical protein n=1 Tax=Kineosporia sp. NBRC 101731 TaxID=3032199 RepID=UPI0024A5D4EB|nr:hypothetical protein [Kineosporia sp. NBRC 101731]GLY33178.1 hypothetical protein Kisp02_65430 [Kineosporia sp. NBRC 101731]
MKSPGFLIGLALLTHLTLTACSTTGDETPPSPAPSSGVIPTDCVTGTDLAETMSDPRVTQIEVLPDCSGVAVSTALDEDEADLALLVCDSAADLAYTAQPTVTGITVISENGNDLATGVRDQACATV